MNFIGWLTQNWMIIVLIVLAIALLVPTYLRQRKEAAARNELASSIEKGTKIVTTAGVYGTVESVENTTDGKVVTIKTGDEKNACTMTIHINAIMGIDNKTIVADEDEIKTDKKNKEDNYDVDEIAEKLQKSSSKKSSKKDTSEE